MLLNKAKAYTMMLEQDLDALVLAYTENVMYFSDFLRVRSNRTKSRPSYVVFFRDEALVPAFLVPHQDYLDSREHTWIEDVRRTSEYEVPGQTQIAHDRPALVARVIAERGLRAGRIGFEDQSLPFGSYQQLRANLSAFELVPASDLVKRLRAVKSDTELGLIREAMRLTEVAGAAILDSVRPGVSERELAVIAEEAAVAGGADGLAFVIVAAQERGAVVHGAPTDYRLQTGDVLRFDLGATCNGFSGDLARTVVVGDTASEAHARHYGALRAAVEAGIAAIAPGVTAGEVYDAQMRAGRQIDPELSREHAGHGLGLEVHEEPMIVSGSDFVLEAGMVVMIENARYLPGKAGYQLEDLVRVTPTGGEVLTTLPRDLVISQR